MKVFIEPYYTRARLHSALDHRPPEEFEHAVAPGMPAGAATMEFFIQQRALTLREARV
jgi:hypothetical protein